MLAIAELFAALRERAEHGEPIRVTFERALVERRPGDVLRLRIELDAMRETIDRALAGQLQAPAQRVAIEPALFDLFEECPEDCPKCNAKAEEIMHDWHLCACESCCSARRSFETQHERGRG